MEKTTEFTFNDPTKRLDLPKWKLELEARIFTEAISQTFPDLLHVPHCVTPDAVIKSNYVPDESVIHFTVPNSRPLRSQRLIFYGQKWQQSEEEHLRAFQNFLREKQLSLPEWWPETESLRVLHAANWDYAKTFAEINTIIGWRQEYFGSLHAGVIEEKHAVLVRSGFFSCHGRDKFHRPLMILRPMVLVRNGFTNTTDLVAAACFAHFYIVNYMHRSGQIENNILIFDLENSSPFNLPVRTFLTIEDTMKAQFKCVTARIFALNCSRSLLMGWSALKPLIDPLVVTKVSLNGPNTCREL